MNLVIDANILFAALIKSGKTSEILFKHTLYAPEFIFEEFRKYKEELKDKTHRSEDDFNNLYDMFERLVILIPEEEINPFLYKAEKISPDPKDTIYLALALKLKCAVWSNDKILSTKQNVVKIYGTTEIISLI